MSKLDEIGTWLTDDLATMAAEHQVPGVAVAVMAGGQVVEAAAGVLSKATGVEATTDSVFQVGSITKVWTTTLAMQLVDEGKLDLDAPIRNYLPDFQVGDHEAAAAMTVRQLMCHVTGFEGDLFTDTGKGDDCVEKYVATLSDTPQLFAPGAMFSYNNAAYCVLGRIVEVLRDKPYDDCLREYLFTPLGLTHAANGPYEAIMYRAAIGHLQLEPQQDPQPAPMYALVRSNAPAGAMLAMRPKDLLAFGRMHLSEGKAADGTQVLSADSVAAMQQPQVELPDLGLMGNAWGLGWEIFDFPGGTVIGHDGGTIGQSAFFRIVPGTDIGVAVLTNGGNPYPLYTAIVGRVLQELAGIELPPLPTPDAEPAKIDASRFVGTYSSSVADQVVTQDDEGRIWLERTPKGIFAELSKVDTNELLPWRGDTLLAYSSQVGLHLPHAFVGSDGDGKAKYLHTGRADPRVAE